MSDDDGVIRQLPDSDPIPEILIIEMNSGPPHPKRSPNEEEEEEEEIIDFEDSMNFSTIPDSTPNLEEEFINSKPEKQSQTSNKNAQTIKKCRSSCCILI